LGDVAQRLACLHPIATAGLTTFHVYACDDGAVGLAGEIELSCMTELERAVEYAGLAAIDGAVVVDLSRLTFADHRALLALAAFAERADVAVAFRAVPAIALRVAGLLHIDGLVPGRTR
jgi:hypothetical protein